VKQILDALLSEELTRMTGKDSRGRHATLYTLLLLYYGMKYDKIYILDIYYIYYD